MKKVIVIPARMASQRFPGKPLCDILGKPMLLWVVEAARQVQGIDQIIIATPDQEILNFAEQIGEVGMYTSPNHLNGTDRTAEIAEKTDADVYITILGDEPLLKPQTVDVCLEALLEHPETIVSSVFCDCETNDIQDSSVVKLVTDMTGNAMYFSRSPMPFVQVIESLDINTSFPKKHIGILAYKREALEKYQQWGPSPLERVESIEPLRFLENGVPIRMKRAEGTPVAVNTPEQAEEVRKHLASCL
jgi:3-deoxy-manno-octulosonate cytidylyltransferase (CMP-KDO synthetase)